MASKQKNKLSGGGLGALMKDTVIYGMSSIVGRFLNYLLVPLYTAKLAVENGGYGIVTEVYSYVALLLVLLTFGMETAFFRFVNKGEDQPERVYSTTLIAVGGVGLLFVIAIILGLQPISVAMGYAQHPEYIAMMVVCVALDAFQCIPFAYLRYKRRPLKFAALKLLFITLNISLNLIYFLVMDGSDVFYIFAINLLCTSSITFLFWKELTGFKWT
ncbi:MAG: oligosaccharide flippase family protein, partial [Bacteroidaceae bacterium]|nr:oligosaccharide flippase family protein [Bacteroidaceae bacterium]